MTNQQRPAGVPDAAFWDEGDQEWVLAQRNGDGQFQGLVTYYRPDGTRCCTTSFVDGTPHGPFSRYHQNQEPSRTGTYVEGTLHGTNVFTRSAAQTTENFPRGLGSQIWRCEMDYVEGNVTEGRLYNREGKRVKEDGEAFPETRPAGVPSTAHYRKPEGHDDYCWVSGAMRDNDDSTGTRVGLWQYWSTDGELILEEKYDDDGERIYDRPANVPADAVLDTDDETWTSPAPSTGEMYTWNMAGVLQSSETYRDGLMERVREYLSDGTLGQDSSLVDGGVPLRKWFRRTEDEELESFPNVTGQHPTALEVEYLFDPHGMMSGYAIRGPGGEVLENERLYRDASNANQQSQFATLDEAARAWTTEGDRYTSELNRWLKELYTLDEPTFEEPTFDRDDLERAVIDGVVALNERGQGSLAHAMFPLYHDGIGKGFWNKYGLVIDRVMHAPDAIYARILHPNRSAAVVRIADNRISPLPGVLAFGASADKRVIAFAYDDRIELRSAQGVKALGYPDRYQHAAVDRLAAGKLGTGSRMNVHAIRVLPNGQDVIVTSAEGIYLVNAAVNASKRLYPLDQDLDTYVEHYGDEPGFSLSMQFPNVDVSPSGDRITCGAMAKRGVMLGLAIYRNASGDWILDNTSQADAFFPIQAVFHKTRPHIAFAACLYASFSNQLTNTTFRIDLDDLQPGELEGFGGGIAQEPGVVRAIASFGDGFLLGFDNGYVRWMGVEDNCQLLGHVFVGGSIQHIDVAADGRTFTVASDAGMVSTFALEGEASRNLIATMPVRDVSRFGFFRTYSPVVW